MPADWVEYERRVAAMAPGDTESIARYMSIVRAVARQVQGEVGDELATWAFRSVEDLYDECGLGSSARAALTHWSGLYGSGPRDTSVAMHAVITDHYMRGAYYPEGGGQVLPARLVEVIEAHGGEVRVHAPVRRVIVEGGRACGVELTSGEVLRAPAVVSNADYHRTMLELVGPQHLDTTTVDAVRAAVTTLPLFIAYVVVDRDLFADRPNTNEFVFPDDPARLFDALEAGRFADEPFTYLSSASRKDPTNSGVCPPGQSNFQLMTLAPRGPEIWGVDGDVGQGARYRRGPEYRELKQRIADQMLDQAEELLGSFRDDIVHLEMASPLTHQRYTASTDGTSYGLQHSPTQIGPLRPGYTTEIDGLFLVGQSTTMGHGIVGTMMGGVACAAAVTGEDLRADLGSVRLVDHERLPPMVTDDDPLEVSRGAAMRAKRKGRRAPSAAELAPIGR